MSAAEMYKSHDYQVCLHQADQFVHVRFIQAWELELEEALSSTLAYARDFYSTSFCENLIVIRTSVQPFFFLH